MSGTRGFVYTTPAQWMVSDKTSISLQVNSRGISGAGSTWEGILVSMARGSHTTGTQPFREEFRLRKLGFEYDKPKHFYSCQVSLPFTFTFLRYCPICNGKKYLQKRKNDKKRRNPNWTFCAFDRLLFMNDNIYSRKMNHWIQVSKKTNICGTLFLNV